MIETILAGLAVAGWSAAIAFGLAWFRAHDEAEAASVRLEALERSR